VPRDARASLCKALVPRAELAPFGDREIVPWPVEVNSVALQDRYRSRLTWHPAPGSYPELHNGLGQTLAQQYLDRAWDSLREPNAL
jgi:hypothetical protein